MTALELIKSVENRAVLMLFMDDPQAKKLLVAWTLYKPRLKDRALKNNETLDEAYYALWRECEEVDCERLSDIAGIPLLTAVQLFRRMQEARLIFPDGTIAKSANTLIVSEVGSYVEDATPRQWIEEAKRKKSSAATK